MATAKGLPAYFFAIGATILWSITPVYLESLSKPTDSRTRGITVDGLEGVLRPGSRKPTSPCTAGKSGKGITQLVEPRRR
jgi:hypothetical protein